MKVKTFWLILLKIIGIFLVLKGVNVVIIHSLTTFSIISTYNSYPEIIWIILSILLTIVIYLFILWLFVFKTSWLVDKLKLEKGFEEERIEINLQLSNVLSIAIIVTGGMMIIHSLPQLCKQIFTFIQMKSLLKESPTIGWIILYGVETVLGYLLITNSKQVTNYINKRNQTDNESESGINE